MERLHMLRKMIFVVFLISIVLMFTTFFAIGQEKYPSKPITLVVGFAPGGVTDVSARAFMKSVEKILKQPIVVINKPGAGTAIQLQFVKNSQPDGYTLGTFTTGGLLGTHLREVPYEFFEDFTHLTLYGTFLFGIAVHPDSPWKTLKELVEYAQKNPGKLKYGSFEPGAPAMLLAESFAFLNGFKWQLITYPGDALCGAALLGKHVDTIVTTYYGWGPHTKAGKLRLLAVFDDKRWKDFPDVPTVKESGYKYSGGFGLLGLLAPKNLPADVKKTLLDALREAWKDPEFLTMMENNACPPIYKEGDEWIKYLKEFDKEAVLIMKQVGLNVIK